MSRSVPVERVRLPASVLAPQVYSSLRAIAGRYMQREGWQPTLQPTALVNEAYLRLAEADRVAWSGKTHFLAVAATEMRRILVERARASAAQKRGGGRRRITLQDELLPSLAEPIELLAIDQAIARLENRHPRQAQVAECRIFAGMLLREISDTLGVSLRTVKDDWAMARAWLARELQPGAGPR